MHFTLQRIYDERHCPRTTDDVYENTGLSPNELITLGHFTLDALEYGGLPDASIYLIFSGRYEWQEYQGIRRLGVAEAYHQAEGRGPRWLPLYKVGRMLMEYRQHLCKEWYNWWWRMLSDAEYEKFLFTVNLTLTVKEYERLRSHWERNMPPRTPPRPPTPPSPNTSSQGACDERSPDEACLHRLL